tara:strand:- start:58 stop:405 length:348 start_codon:yes stop_codon:yes gene_type:complete
MTYSPNQNNVNRKDFEIFPGESVELSVAIEPYDRTDEFRCMAYSMKTKSVQEWAAIQAGSNAGYVAMHVPHIDGVLENLGWKYQLQKRPAGGANSDWRVVARGRIASSGSIMNLA